MKQFGHYQLLVRLGAGGAANVFLVRDTEHDGRLLALKVLLPELAADRDALAMFFNEARISARLEHENVVKVHGFGRVEGIHCMAMEYVFGASLSTILAESARARRPLSVGVLLTMVSRVCAGLHYAHELRGDAGQKLGLVHRDVTAQNILVSFDGVPKLSDFGIAKATDRGGYQTQTGVVKGKYAYMSPEQSMGKKLDQRSDVFTMGILLWESLTGRVLFDAPSVYDCMKAIQEAPIQPPSMVAPELSPLVDPIVMRALERLPANRYQTAQELEQDITQLVARAGLDIDANAIAVELSGIFGSAIGERGLVLRSAMEGEAEPKLLAKVMGVSELEEGQLPLVPGGTSDPDPLRLFSSGPRVSRVRAQSLPARPERALSSDSFLPSLGPTLEPGTDVSEPSREDLASLAGLEPAESEDVKRYSTVDGWVDGEFRADGSSRLISLISADDARTHTLSQSFSAAVGGATGDLSPVSATIREDSTDRSNPASGEFVDTLPGGAVVEGFEAEVPTAVTDPDGEGETHAGETRPTPAATAAVSPARPGGVQLTWGTILLIALGCMTIGSLLTLLLFPR